MKKTLKGSYTIEAAFIVPMILSLFVVLVYVLFYYHDKNIVAGAAYETLAMGTGRMEYDAEELSVFFQERIQGKLLLFGNIEDDIEIRKEEIRIQCEGRKKYMRFKVIQKARVTEPEEFIRNLRKFQMIGEGL